MNDPLITGELYQSEQSFYLQSMTRGCIKKFCTGDNLPMTVADLLNHYENSCSLAKVLCPNEGCGESIIKAHPDHHYMNCPYSLFSCPVCKEIIIVSEKHKGKSDCIDYLKGVLHETRNTLKETEE